MTHTVLIVDDSKLARMAVAKSLKFLRPEWTQVEATNAAEARAHIRERNPDIVLLDFNMPGENGLILATELCQTNPGIRLAMISANRQEEIVCRAREAGASFLAKPLTNEALGAFLGGAP